MKMITAAFLATILLFPAGFGLAQAPNSGSQTGKVVGGAAGAYIGSQLTSNKLLGAFLGGLGGSLFGGFIGGNLGGADGASSGGGSKNTFGGKITYMYPCTCTPGSMLIYIGPPKGGTFVLTLGAKLHSNARPVTGSWVIGDYSPIGTCYMIGYPCYPVPNQGTITRIGTS